MKLKFQPTRDDYRYCNALSDSTLYYKVYGLPVLWQMGAFEFITQLIEFMNDIDGHAEMGTLQYFYKYFS